MFHDLNYGMNSRENLETEGQNPNYASIDKKSIHEILCIINHEDKSVACEIENAILQIEETVKLCVSAIKNGHRIFYFGAGTSGRLGVLDASEIPPTFSVDSSLFNGIIF